jgi:hypothetical protein
MPHGKHGIGNMASKEAGNSADKNFHVCFVLVSCSIWQHFSDASISTFYVGYYAAHRDYRKDFAKRQYIFIRFLLYKNFPVYDPPVIFAAFALVTQRPERPFQDQIP